MKSITHISRKPENSRPSSASGLTGVKEEAISTVFSVIPFLIKTAVIAGGAYFLYNKYINRFKDLKEKSNYPDANITKAQAESRANAIHKSMPLIGQPDLMEVGRALSGLNYNGFIRVYNAFGHRRGEWLSGEVDLVEWLNQQFSAENFEYLGALQNHAFFRTAAGSKPFNYLNIFKNPEILYLDEYATN